MLRSRVTNILALGAAAGSGAGKRKREDGGFAVPEPKVRRPEAAAAALPPEEDERARALRMMEADTAPVDAQGLDVAGVRRLINGLERKVCVQDLCAWSAYSRNRFQNPWKLTCHCRL